MKAAEIPNSGQIIIFKYIETLMYRAPKSIYYQILTLESSDFETSIKLETQLSMYMFRRILYGLQIRQIWIYSSHILKRIHLHARQVTTRHIPNWRKIENFDRWFGICIVTHKTVVVEREGPAILKILRKSCWYCALDWCISSNKLVQHWCYHPEAETTRWWNYRSSMMAFKKQPIQ